MKKLAAILMAVALALAAAMLTSCADNKDKDKASFTAPSGAQADTASTNAEAEPDPSRDTGVSEAESTSSPVGETEASDTEQSYVSQTVSETEAAAEADEADKGSQSRLYAEYGSLIEEIKNEAFFRGDCSANIKWYYKDGVMLISGEGEMPVDYLTDEDEYIAPWEKGARFPLAEKIDLVIIDEGVTSICGGAFYRTFNLRKAVLSDTVERIGESAFSQCWMLESIDMPESLKSIGDQAFCNCESLGEVVIPDSVEEIGMDPFLYCWSADITLPYGLTEVNLYDICPEAESVTIPASVTKIDEFGYHRNITFLGDAPELPVWELLSEYDEVVGLALSGLNEGYDTDMAGTVFTPDRVETGVTIYYSGKGFDKYIEMCPQYHWVKK